MRHKLQSIAHQFQQVFEGDPWYGTSVMETLSSIPEAHVNVLFQDKSILRLVRHMIAWRTFALNKLEGNAEYDIDEELDWPSDDALSWREVVQTLGKNQQQLLLALEKTPSSKLAEKVPGRNYSFAALLDGLLQHDIYHLGQISLLNKLAAP